MFHMCFRIIMYVYRHSYVILKCVFLFFSKCYYMLPIKKEEEKVWILPCLILLSCYNAPNLLVHDIGGWYGHHGWFADIQIVLWGAFADC